PGLRRPGAARARGAARRQPGARAGAGQGERRVAARPRLRDHRAGAELVAAPDQRGAAAPARTGAPALRAPGEGAQADRHRAEVAMRSQSARARWLARPRTAKLSDAMASSYRLTDAS